MKLSPHFSLHEWHCHGDDTPYPAEWIETRLQRLVPLLEAIRTLCGDRMITITSGYRTPAYNRQVGGARNSQHVLGRAADIVVKGLSARQVQQRILAARTSGLSDTPLCAEDEDLAALLGGLGCYRSFTHVDVREVGQLVRWNG